MRQHGHDTEFPYLSHRQGSGRSGILHPGWVAVVLALLLLVPGQVGAQAIGPAMNLQAVLSNFVDNDHSGNITQGDQLNFTDTATNTGTVHLTNVHVSDTFNPAGITCPGITPGQTCPLSSSHIVTAADVSAGQVVDTATATSNELPPQSSGSGVPTIPPTLSLVSGNNQDIPVNSRSAPLVVQLTNNGVPVANATINWSATKAVLAHRRSTTDASGKASNTAVLLQTGAASVSASSVSPAAGPVTFVLNGGFSSITGLTLPEAQVANALDHACPTLAGLSSLTSAQQDLLAQCRALAAAAGQNPDKVTNALNQMLPHNALLQTNASILVADAQFDNIKARLAAIRSGNGGDHFGGLAFSSPDGVLPMGQLGDAALGFDAKQTAQTREAGAGFDRFGFFLTGTFGNGSADPRQATPGYGFHSGGITAGVDYRVSDQVIVGVSAGYANYSSNVDVVGGGLDTHGWSLSAYSTVFRQDNWYVDGVLTGSKNNYDINRRITYALTTSAGTVSVDQIATSHSNGVTLAGALTLGRDFSKGPWSFGPYLRGTWARTDFGSYQETLNANQPGSGLGLAVQNRVMTNGSSVLGGKVTLASSQSWGVVLPHAEVEWEHDFQNNPDSITARFLQDPTATPFQLRGDAIDADFFRLGLGLSFQFERGRSGFIYYEKILGLSGVTQNNLSLGFRMEF